MQPDTASEDGRARPDAALGGGGGICLEIAFHYDVRRIGERTRAVFPPGETVVIGRDLPRFGEARPPRGLEDRCISRNQMQARLLPEGTGLELTPNPDVRQPLARVRLDDPAPMEPLAGPARFHEGDLVAVGQRVLLRVVRAVPDDARDAALGLLGNSEAIRRLRQEIRTAAEFRAHVLIVGETGSGKERAARGIHVASGAAGRFVALNMSGMEPQLAGSELFGHARGAFTGAHRDRPGAFDEAAGGTLFLDEIGDMPAEIQRKLLRVLEEHRYTPIGDREARDVRCRVIAASNKALAEEVRAGRFRLDLFERLAAIEMHVPPLAAHREDIPLLFAALLAEQVAGHAGLAHLLRDGGPSDPTPVPMSFFVELMRAGWPGNVRGLRNAAIATAAANLRAAHFTAPPLVERALAAEPSRLPSPAPAEVAAQPRPPSTGSVDRDTLLAALEAEDHNQVAVAARLGLARSSLIALMEMHGIRRARDLTGAEIDAARAACENDLVRMSRRLGVSLRALKLRLGRAD